MTALPPCPVSGCCLPAHPTGGHLPYPYEDTVPAMTIPAVAVPVAVAEPVECPTCWGGGRTGPAGEPWTLYVTTAGERTLAGWFAGPIHPQPCPGCAGTGHLPPGRGPR